MPTTAPATARPRRPTSVAPDRATSASTWALGAALLAGTGLALIAARLDAVAGERPSADGERSTANGGGSAATGDRPTTNGARRTANDGRPTLFGAAGTRRALGAMTLTLTGVVLDVDGVPAAGVDVEARPRDGALEAPAATTTDRDGRFALPIRAAYGAVVQGHVVARRGDQVGSVSFANGAPGEVDDLEITLGPALELVGAVRVGGLPRAGVAVRITRIGGVVEIGTPDVVAISGADGGYQAALFGPGLYQVSAALGTAEVTAAPYLQVLAGATRPTVDVELPAMREAEVAVFGPGARPLAGVAIHRLGADVDGPIAFTGRDGIARILIAEPERDARTWPRVRLQADGYDATAVLVGPDQTVVVLDAAALVAGEVVAGATGVVTVELRREDGLVEASATLPQPGRFALTVAPGAYELVASVAGAGQSAPIAVEVERGERGELGPIEVVGPVGSLVGVVRDAEGEPVADASIALIWPGDVRQQATADARGRFAMPRVPAGPARISTWAGGQEIDEAIEIDADGPTEVELVPAFAAEPEPAVAEVEPDDVEGDEADDEIDEEPEGDAHDDGEDAYAPTYQPAFDAVWTADGMVVTGPGYGVDDPGAALHGLLPGDVILTIDGARWDEGSLYGGEGRVRLEVLRPATGKRLRVEVPRDREVEEGGC
jgi:hypothetical protein